MTYPIINFDDPDLDWNAVEILLKEMFSDLNAQTGCCKSKPIEKAFNQAMPFIQLLDHDRGSNTIRWQSDIKSAYLLLQPYTSGPSITTTNGQTLTLPFILT